MSIIEAVWQRIGEGTLIELKPLPQDSNVLFKRKMYLTATLYEELKRDWSDIKKLERFACLEADLLIFLTSATLDSKYMTCLSPFQNGVWQIKSVRPKPGVRVFGFFAAKDLFVATHYVFRKGMKNFNSKEYEVEIRRGKAIWRQLFPTYNYMSSNSLTDLATGAIHEKYCR
jgi:hypothetical protein